MYQAKAMQPSAQRATAAIVGTLIAVTLAFGALAASSNAADDLGTKHPVAMIRKAGGKPIRR